MYYLQDLLKTRLLKLLPLKVGEVLQIMEREFPTHAIGFSHYGIISATFVDSV